MPISEYCKNCKINIRLFCNRNNVHKGNKNDRVYYGVIIPSNYNYDNLNYEIKKREKIINKLKLNNWKNKIE